MSDDGAGPIIIRNLIDNSQVSILEKSELQQIISRCQLNGGKIGFFDRRYVIRLVKSLLK